MANIFNNCFVSEGSTIDKTMTRKSPADYLKNRISQSICLTSVTPEEIETIMQSLIVKKAPCPDSIPLFLLKILSGHTALPLSIIVNQSFEAGVFSDKLKIGKVNLIHKKDSSDNPSNYRPIFILSGFFSKLLKN